MRGYIYCLSAETENDVFYVGVTTNPKNRLISHRGNYPQYLMGCKINLDIIEEVEVENRKELSKYEMFWIHQFVAWGFELNNYLLGYGYDNKHQKMYIDFNKEMDERLKNGTWFLR